MPGIARPSVASLLLGPQFQGQPLSTATGFVVLRDSRCFLITNWHVVTGRRTDNGAPLSPTGGVPNELAVCHNQAGALGNWVVKVESLYTETGQPRWLEHPTHRRMVDVVALEFTKADDVDLYPHDPWANEPAVAVGVTQPLSIVGFPFGLTGGGRLGVWVQGTVATEPGLDFGDLPSFLIDSRTRPGQSGSPVVFYSAGGTVPMADGGTTIFGGPVERCLGVYSGRINNESDLGFVWKAAALTEIIDDGVPGEV